MEKFHNIDRRETIVYLNFQYFFYGFRSNFDCILNIRWLNLRWCVNLQESFISVKCDAAGQASYTIFNIILAFRMCWFGWEKTKRILVIWWSHLNLDVRRMCYTVKTWIYLDVKWIWNLFLYPNIYLYFKWSLRNHWPRFHRDFASIFVNRNTAIRPNQLVPGNKSTFLSKINAIFYSGQYLI